MLYLLEDSMYLAYGLYILTAVLGLIILGGVLSMFGRRIDPSSVRELVAPSRGPRFRKRDKIAFVSNKVMRNARGMASIIQGGRGVKRKALARLAKRIIPFRNESPREDALRPDLPEAFLEEAMEDITERQTLPQELVYVLKNMRVFGHFSQDLFLELLREIETIRVPQNQYLFRLEDQDTNMYIVQSGTISVLNVNHVSQELDSKSIVLKNVKQGEPIVSLLSFLEYMNPCASQKRSYDTVAAKAIEESKVIKISFETFKKGFEKHPGHLSRVVQIIMLRLQRVTLLAINKYLGLGAELITSEDRGKMNDSESFMNISESEKDQIKSFAIQKLREALGLDPSEENKELDKDFPPDSVDIIDFSKGSILVEENTCHDNYLILVLKGCFKVSQKADNMSKELHKAYPGGLLGQLQVLTGEHSLFTIEACADSQVAVVHSSVVHDIFGKNPNSILHLALSVIGHLSTYVRSVDFALEWTLVESGKALYKQDDVADCIYVVLSGRLRSIISRSCKKELVAEYGRGELTGIVETLTNSKRSTTVMAIRDTEVAKLPSGLINSIKSRYPMVLLRLINLLGKKLQRTWEKGTSHGGGLSVDDDSSSFSTVALIAITPGVPLSAFAHELNHAASFIGPTLRLTADIIKKELGPSAFDKTHDFRLSNWLAQREDQHKLVLYQCDKDLTTWSQLCIRHADVILLIANPSASTNSDVSALEEKIEYFSQRTRKELVFIHPESVEYPEGTRNWLNNRAWINSHTHIRCPPRVFFKKKEVRVDDYYSKIFIRKMPMEIFSDFSRLARILTGTSVGLVLGGGGARGCSHVGMIKAILEAGIPIDRVAGVSIGAFMGALYSQEREMTKFTVKARSFAEKVSSKWRQAIDITYPHTALFTGKAFNAQIEDFFKERDIEDLWLPFFTVTTDITDSCMRVHDYGSLWRYVRSSMSLAGYLPPLCDPHDGHLLLDGGYTNNLPADVMRSRGACHILAIDVGAQDETNMSNYGDHLSGWEVLWRKWNPFASALKVPDHTDIQSRLAYVSCVRQLECVKKSDYCDYIRPPIDEFRTLQFGSFDEIKDVGYHHGRTYFMGLAKAGRMINFPWATMMHSSNPNSRRNSLSLHTFNSSISFDLGDLHSNPLQGLNMDYKAFSLESPGEPTDHFLKDPDYNNMGGDDEEDDESGFLSQM